MLSIERAVDDGDKCLGIECEKEVRTPTKHGSPDCVENEWAWEAKEGRVLVWNASAETPVPLLTAADLAMYEAESWWKSLRLKPYV
jgi:hypothetical protein